MAVVVIDISHLHVPVNDVIILKADVPDETLDDLIADLHERFRSSLVVWMDSQSSFETMEEDELESLLKALIDHRRARDE